MSGMEVCSDNLVEKLTESRNFNETFYVTFKRRAQDNLNGQTTTDFKQSDRLNGCQLTGNVKPRSVVDKGNVEFEFPQLSLAAEGHVTTKRAL